MAAGRVYAYGISSILTCLDANSGTSLWQKDMKRMYAAAPAEYGTASSPLVHQELVVVSVEIGRAHV